MFICPEDRFLGRGGSVVNAVHQVLLGVLGDELLCPVSLGARRGSAEPHPSRLPLSFLGTKYFNLFI